MSIIRCSECKTLFDESACINGVCGNCVIKKQHKNVSEVEKPVKKPLSRIDGVIRGQCLNLASARLKNNFETPEYPKRLLSLAKNIHEEVKEWLKWE